MKFFLLANMILWTLAIDWEHQLPSKVHLLHYIFPPPLILRSLFWQLDRRRSVSIKLSPTPSTKDSRPRTKSSNWSYGNCSNQSILLPEFYDPPGRTFCPDRRKKKTETWRRIKEKRERNNRNNQEVTPTLTYLSAKSTEENASEQVSSQHSSTSQPLSTVWDIASNYETITIDNRRYIFGFILMISFLLVHICIFYELYTIDQSLLKLETIARKQCQASKILLYNIINNVLVCFTFLFSFCLNIWWCKCIKYIF